MSSVTGNNPISLAGVQPHPLPAPAQQKETTETKTWDLCGPQMGPPQVQALATSQPCRQGQLLHPFKPWFLHLLKGGTESSDDSLTPLKAEVQFQSPHLPAASSEEDVYHAGCGLPE